MRDVIIVGGGIVGTSLARELSKYQLDVLLLEKNIEVSQETTKANTAIAHGGYDCEPGSLKAKLNVRGLELMEELSKDLGFVFNKIGSLVLAFNDQEVGVLEELLERGRKNKVPNLQIIDKEEILKIEPKVSSEVMKALYCPQAGVIDPFNFCYGMIENAIENGVELRTETEVQGIDIEEDKIIVKTNNSEFETRYLVNAAGLYADKIANMVGDEDFYIIPTKGVYRLLDKNKNYNINTVLFQTPNDDGKGVVVTSTYDGNTMLGPTSERIHFVEENTTEADSLLKLDSLAKKSVPDVDLKNTIRVFTGVRAKPNTGDFMIYPSKHTKHVVHAAGIESPGLVSAPGIAEYVTELLKEQGLELTKKDSFNPIRKEIKRISLLSNEDKIKAIEENPNYGNVICRCETVSEAEIIEAIRRPAGARTIDGVKRRVRAGMGRCQGGFCGPRVLEILARELNIDPIDVKKETSGSEIVSRHLKA